jgi:hypothetical protein
MAHAGSLSRACDGFNRVSAGGNFSSQPAAAFLLAVPSEIFYAVSSTFTK